MKQLSLKMIEGSIDLPANEPFIYTWGYEYNDVFCYPGPLIKVEEGEDIELTITNLLLETHNFIILGTEVREPIEPQQTKVISFHAPPAGTYLYGDTLNPISRALGLMGGLISMPAGIDNQPWVNGPIFSREYLWVFSSLDSNWNKAVKERQPVDINNYNPNYFFINGLAFPEGMNKMSMPSMPDMEGLMIHEIMGAKALIRMINTSLVPHCPHQHGFHWEQVSVNRLKLDKPLLKDNILLYPNDTVDVILTFDKMGSYMMHDHILMAVTANGVYPNGGLVMFEIM